MESHEIGTRLKRVVGKGWPRVLDLLSPEKRQLRRWLTAVTDYLRGITVKTDGGSSQRCVVEG